MPVEMTPGRNEVIRVVVVDDEPYLLRHIAQSIRDSHEDFDVVGEAHDGEEALAVIESTRPEIVFTDIRMPIMDGLALIRELKEQGSPAIPVILSGHQEFEYAKRAMKLEVSDYLLKPINPNSLEKLLEDLRRQVLKEREEQRLNFLEHKLNFLKRPAGEDIDVGRLFVRYQHFHGLLICAGASGNHAFSRPVPSQALWMELALEDVVSQMLREEESAWIIVGDMPNERIVLLGSRRTRGFPFDELSYRIHKTISSTAVPVTTIHADMPPAFDDFADVIMNMRARMMQRNIFGSSSYGRYQPGVQDKTAGSGSRLILQPKTIRLMIEHKREEYLRKEVRNALDSHEMAGSPQYLLEQELRQLYMVILAGHERDAEWNVEDVLMNSLDYKTLRRRIDDALKTFFRKHAGRSSGKTGIEETLSAVEDDIRATYLDQISVSHIARNHGLTPSYLSSAFRKYRGLTPVEFIRNLKLEKAKELLLAEPVMSVSEIADAVGYEDQFYFSRVFRRVVGFSPTEFRKRSHTCQN